MHSTAHLPNHVLHLGSRHILAAGSEKGRQLVGVDHFVALGIQLLERPPQIRLLGPPRIAQLQRTDVKSSRLNWQRAP